MQEAFTIGTLATVVGVSVETVRYYQRRGLMPEPFRPQGGVRHYSSTDVERLHFIRRAQSVGFTLAEIDALLEMRAKRSCRATRALAATKLLDVDARIRELCHLREELAEWIVACDSNTDEASCPVMERLAAPTT